MNERILDLIKKLYSQYGTFNPFELADNHNVEVLYVEFGNNPLGQYINLFDKPTILLNEKIETSSQKFFVLAHELFHYLDHEELSGYYVQNSITRGKLETEANLFAAILMTNYYVEEMDKLPSTVKELELNYGVPCQLAEDYI